MSILCAYWPVINVGFTQIEMEISIRCYLLCILDDLHWGCISVVCSVCSKAGREFKLNYALQRFDYLWVYV
jgi:hypothetical protein